MLTNRPGTSLVANKRMCIWVNHWRVICVTLWLIIVGRVRYANKLAQSTERSRGYGSYELPHLAVDSADHSHSERQQEGHLHMSRLSWFVGFGIDDRVAGAS